MQALQHRISLEVKGLQVFIFTESSFAAISGGSLSFSLTVSGKSNDILNRRPKTGSSWVIFDLPTVFVFVVPSVFYNFKILKNNV